MSTYGPRAINVSETERFNVLVVGTTMPDGTVYAGVSPSNGTAMFAAPADGPLTKIFNEARDYVARLFSHGRGDWRVPTHEELRVLFQNRSAIGGFTGSRYWSSTPFGHSAMMTQDFEDPDAGADTPAPEQISLRYVRG